MGALTPLPRCSRPQPCHCTCSPFLSKETPGKRLPSSSKRAQWMERRAQPCKERPGDRGGGPGLCLTREVWEQLRDCCPLPQGWISFQHPALPLSLSGSTSESCFEGMYAGQPHPSFLLLPRTLCGCGDPVHHPSGPPALWDFPSLLPSICAGLPPCLSLVLSTAIQVLP